MLAMDEKTPLGTAEGTTYNQRGVACDPSNVVKKESL